MSRIAFVVDEDFEDSELIKPYAALRQAGYEVEIIGVEAGKHVRGKKGHDETIERAARDSDVASYAALVIPRRLLPRSSAHEHGRRLVRAPSRSTPRTVRRRGPSPRCSRCRTTMPT